MTRLLLAALEQRPYPAHRQHPLALADRGCAAGVLVRHCDGTKVDPYRYALAEAAAAPKAPAAAVGSPEPMLAPSPLPSRPVPKRSPVP